MKREAKLGQHFLNAQWVARDLVRSIRLRPHEPIVEVGPGRGALTKELLAHGARVLAIEKDGALVSFLRERFADEIRIGALTIVEGDIRDLPPQALGLSGGTYAVAANIPYYITGEIIRLFLGAQEQPRAMALLVQKEVAERIRAAGGKESILSLSVKAYGRPSIVAKVPRGCFNPPPAVDSAILLIESVSRDFFSTMEEEVFFKIVRAGFSSKRKLLANNIKSLIADTEEAFSMCDIPIKARAEDLKLEEWKCVVQKLATWG